MPQCPLVPYSKPNEQDGSLLSQQWLDYMDEDKASEIPVTAPILTS